MTIHKKVNKLYVSFDIIHGSPGIGKTKGVAEYVVEHPKEKIGLIYQSHDIIDETKQRIDEEINHWQGFTRLCEEYKKSRIVRYLHDQLGLTASVLCRMCGKKVCSYKELFTRKERLVAAPFEYLKTLYLLNYKIKTIFADEPSLKIDVIEKPNYFDLNKFTNAFNTLADTDFHPNYIIEHLKYVRKIVENFIITTLSCDSNKVPKYINDLCSINLYKLEKWVALNRIYGLDKDYGIPLLFYAFDHAVKGVNVALIDANPPFDLIRQLVRRYNYENQTNLVVKFKIKGKLQNKNSRVFRITSKYKKNAWYPPCSHPSDGIKAKIDLLKEVMNSGKIGFVTFKDHTDEYCKVYPHLTYGDLRSSNILEDVNALFVVGTYQVNLPEFYNDFELFFVEKPITKSEYDKKEGGYKFTNPKMESLNKALSINEMYHAIHRARPLLYDKDIFVFGKVPPKIKDELDYYDIDDIKVLATMYWLENRMKTCGSDGRLSYASENAKLQIKLKIGVNLSRKLIKEAVELSKKLEMVELRGGRGRPQKVISLR